jgi:hypothetical protein
MGALNCFWQLVPTACCQQIKKFGDFTMQQESIDENAFLILQKQSKNSMMHGFVSHPF